MELKDKIALVTGASRGIGKAIANSLADEGITVIGTATTVDGAQKISEYLSPKGGKGYVLNITDQNSIDECLKGIQEEFGTVDILVNNAGITKDNLFIRMKEEEWMEVMDINLHAVFRLIKANMRGMMKKRWGRIVNISSVVGVTGNPGQANYVAAKAGLIGLSKSIAQEYATRNITTNIVAPGFICTEMTDVLTDAQKDQMIQKVPMGTMGKPENIAQAVLFLVKADYITGETIHVNGGMFMG